MIGYEDLDRLVAEITQSLGRRTPNQEVRDWLGENEIDEEAINRMMENLSMLFAHDLATEGTGFMARSVEACCMQAFMIGWEAQKQYGERGNSG